MGSPIYVSKQVGLAQRGVFASPKKFQEVDNNEGKTVPLISDDDRLPVTLL
jgi:hypothetical protein